MKQTKKQQKLAIGRIMSRKSTLADRCNNFNRLDSEFFSDMLSYFFYNIVEKSNENFTIQKHEKNLEKYKIFETKIRTNKPYARKKIIEFCENNPYYYIADFNDFDSSGYMIKLEILKNIESDCFVYYCSTIQNAVSKLQKKIY